MPTQTAYSEQRQGVERIIQEWPGGRLDKESLERTRKRSASNGNPLQRTVLRERGSSRESYKRATEREVIIQKSLTNHINNMEIRGTPKKRLHRGYIYQTKARRAATDITEARRDCRSPLRATALVNTARLGAVTLFAVARQLSLFN